MNQEIEEAVRETLGATNMEKNYPKYQLSKFLGGNKDYQVVVRADDFDEFQEAMNNMKKLVKILEKKTNGETSNHPKAKCKDCGAEMIYKSGNKNGKKWEGLFCPNSQKGQKGHDPVWL